MTDEEVKKLFPDLADIKKFAELMEIVKRAGDQNELAGLFARCSASLHNLMLRIMQLKN